jgi:polyisoprenoid-binding protein YceI
MLVAKIGSGNPLLDREMRRRIDARRYPTISGALTGMRPIEGDRYRVAGEVTFKGVTRPYEEEMTVAMIDPSTIRFQGEHTFDVRDFGMEPPRILTLRVHADVAVRVDIVAHDGGGSA